MPQREALLAVVLVNKVQVAIESKDRPLNNGISYRAKRTKYYRERFSVLLKSIHIEGIDGYQRYDQFILNRLDRAYSLLDQIGSLYNELVAKEGRLRQQLTILNSERHQQDIKIISAIGEFAFFTILVPFYALELTEAMHIVWLEGMKNEFFEDRMHHVYTEMARFYAYVGLNISLSRSRKEIAILLERQKLRGGVFSRLYKSIEKRRLLPTLRAMVEISSAGVAAYFLAEAFYFLINKYLKGNARYLEDAVSWIIAAEVLAIGVHHTYRLARKAIVRRSGVSDTFSGGSDGGKLLL